MRTTRGIGCVLLVLVSSCGGADAASPASAAPTSAGATSAPPPPPANPDADAVEAARPSLRACYDKARTTNPSLGRTTVSVSLGVGATGQVSTVDLEYKHRFDDAAKACMRDAAFAIKLPPGAARKVEVPVTFEPK
jgi:hypothetical protein